MLILRDRGPRLCDGLTRRDVLQAGGLAALGLSLPQLLAREALAKTTESAPRSAKSCIVLFLMGGSPQHSTFDPKPDAPPEIRGTFSPIATAVPGTYYSELLPGLAERADKLAILRAVSTTDNAHSSSGYYMLTGHPHAPMNAENANPGTRTTGRSSARWFSRPPRRAAICPAASACRATSSIRITPSGPDRTPGSWGVRRIPGSSAADRLTRISGFPNSASRSRSLPTACSVAGRSSKASTSASSRSNGPASPHATANCPDGPSICWRRNVPAARFGSIWRRPRSASNTE